MKKHDVIVLPRAEAEIDEAMGWVRQFSQVQAERWHGRLMDAIQSLETLPHRCPLAPESITFKEEIRQLLFGKRRGTYRILFTVVDDKVFIISVRHGARKPLRPRRRGPAEE